MLIFKSIFLIYYPPPTLKFFINPASKYALNMLIKYIQKSKFHYLIHDWGETVGIRIKKFRNTYLLNCLKH